MIALSSDVLKLLSSSGGMGAWLYPNPIIGNIVNGVFLMMFVLACDCIPCKGDFLAPCIPYLGDVARVTCVGSLDS